MREPHVPVNAVFEGEKFGGGVEKIFREILAKNVPISVKTEILQIQEPQQN